MDKRYWRIKVTSAEEKNEEFPRITAVTVQESWSAHSISLLMTTSTRRIPKLRLSDCRMNDKSG